MAVNWSRWIFVEEKIPEDWELLQEQGIIELDQLEQQRGARTLIFMFPRIKEPNIFESLTVSTQQELDAQINHVVHEHKLYGHPRVYAAHVKPEMYDTLGRVHIFPGSMHIEIN